MYVYCFVNVQFFSFDTGTYLIFLFFIQNSTHHDVAERVCRMPPHLRRINHQLHQHLIGLIGSHAFETLYRIFLSRESLELTLSGHVKDIYENSINSRIA